MAGPGHLIAVDQLGVRHALSIVSIASPQGQGRRSKVEGGEHKAITGFPVANPERSDSTAVPQGAIAIGGLAEAFN
jgi:hypothetical protein